MYISSSISKEQSRPASHPSAAKNTSCAVGDFYITSCSVPLPFSGRCDSLIVYAYVYVHTAFVTVSINPLNIPPSNPPTLRSSCGTKGQVNLPHCRGGSLLLGCQDRVLEAAETHVHKKEGEGDEEIQTLSNKTPNKTISFLITVETRGKKVKLKTSFFMAMGTRLRLCLSYISLTAVHSG